MARTSQCCRTRFFQPDGPATLTAAELLPCTRKPPTSFFAGDRAASPCEFSPEQKWSFPFARIKARRAIYRALRARPFGSNACVDFESCLSKQGVNRSSARRPGKGNRQRFYDRRLVRESVIQEVMHGGPRN